jgi:hypothetical protein
LKVADLSATLPQNEITEVPFFDVKLPKEVGIKVFSFLDYRDLCHCSQVSWSWHALADDEVLWCRICQKHGLEKEPSLGLDNDLRQSMLAIISSHVCTG